MDASKAKEKTPSNADVGRVDATNADAAAPGAAALGEAGTSSTCQSKEKDATKNIVKKVTAETKLAPLKPPKSKLPPLSASAEGAKAKAKSPAKTQKTASTSKGKTGTTSPLPARRSMKYQADIQTTDDGDAAGDGRSVEAKKDVTAPRSPKSESSKPRKTAAASPAKDGATGGAAVAAAAEKGTPSKDTAPDTTTQTQQPAAERTTEKVTGQDAPIPQKVESSSDGAAASNASGRHAELGDVDWDSWDAVEAALRASRPHLDNGNPTSTSHAGGSDKNTASVSNGNIECPGLVAVLLSVPWSPTSLYVAESLDKCRGELPANVNLFVVNADFCPEKVWELGVESPVPTMVIYSEGRLLGWRRPTRELSVRLDYGITRATITTIVRCALDAAREGRSTASLSF